MTEDNERVRKHKEKARQHREEFNKQVGEMKRSWQELETAPRVILIVGAIVGIIWMLLPSVSEEESHCGANIHAENSAYAAAIVFIERRLRDPDSAIHPPEPISVSWLGGCDHLVTGSVRARNGFGGYSQHVYVVQTHYDLATSTPSARLVSFD